VSWHLVPIESKPFAHAVSLRKRDRVLLLFANGAEEGSRHTGRADDELIWVEVKSKTEGSYIGTVVTQKPRSQEILTGDSVWFQARHVHKIGERTPWLWRFFRRITGR
jgi:hypothetical protein